MALTTSGSAADAAAADVYGHPADSTRMNRERGTVAVAAAYTSGSASDAAMGAAFIDGGTLGQATRT